MSVEFDVEKLKRMIAADAPDEEMTADRQKGLAVLPANMPEIELALGTYEAHRFIQWCGRTNRVKFDRAKCKFLLIAATPKGEDDAE